jgi:hypothetical protein
MFFFQDHNVIQWVVDWPMDLDILSRLWKKLFSNAMLCACLNEFMKVAKLTMV